MEIIFFYKNNFKKVYFLNYCFIVGLVYLVYLIIGDNLVFCIFGGNDIYLRIV